MRSLVTWMLLLLSACGGGRARPASHADGNTTVEILTTDDPATFAPAPTPTAETGVRAGVVVGGASREAIQVARLFFDSIRTRDVQVLHDLLGETILRGGQPRPTEQELLTRFATADRASFGLSANTADYFDFEHAMAATVGETYSGGIPPSLREDDIVVLVAPRALGLELVADITRAASAVRMIIRMRPQPHILGY